MVVPKQDNRQGRDVRHAFADVSTKNFERARRVAGNKDSLPLGKKVANKIHDGVRLACPRGALDEDPLVAA